jgi:hypothetical protein
MEMFVHTDGTYPVSCPVVFNKNGRAEIPADKRNKRMDDGEYNE